MANSFRKRRTRTRSDRDTAPPEPVVALPFPSGSRWDVALTEKQLRRLSWPEKQLRVLESLKRKIAALQEYADRPTSFPADFSVPKNRKALREWSDPLRGLWPWSWAKLDNPDHSINGKFIESFWSTLDRIQAGPRTNRSEFDDRIRERDATIAALKLQNLTLMAEVIDLRKRIYGK